MELQAILFNLTHIVKSDSMIIYGQLLGNPLPGSNRR
jgi:hypothetical protein